VRDREARARPAKPAAGSDNWLPRLLRANPSRRQTPTSDSLLQAAMATSKRSVSPIVRAPQSIRCQPGRCSSWSPVNRTRGGSRTTSRATCTANRHTSFPGAPESKASNPRNHSRSRRRTPGIFAAGDVRQGSIERVDSAVGDGATVVRQLHEHLERRPTPRPQGEQHAQPATA
jgi:hypothetical protein